MDTLFEGFQVTVIGMGVVFLVLFLLTLILQLFEAFLYKGKDKEGIKPTRSTELNKSQKEEGLDEVVVAVSAVMADILDKNECVININQLN